MDPGGSAFLGQGEAAEMRVRAVTYRRLLKPEPGECLERIRLVDEYSRAVTVFNSVLESLRAASRHLDPRSWDPAETARAESQVAWEAVEGHILRHRCLDLHWTAAAPPAADVVGEAARSAMD